jgi:hypothetical protein
MENPQLFVKQIGAFSFQTCTLASDAQILTRRTTYHDINLTKCCDLFFSDFND